MAAPVTYGEPLSLSGRMGCGNRRTGSQQAVGTFEYAYVHRHVQGTIKAPVETGAPIFKEAMIR